MPLGRVATTSSIVHMDHMPDRRQRQKSLISSLVSDTVLGAVTQEGLRVRGSCRFGIGKGDRRPRVEKTEEGVGRRRRGVSCTVGIKDGDRGADCASARTL